MVACECSSVGRASRCQRDGRRFKSDHSLHILKKRRFFNLLFFFMLTHETLKSEKCVEKFKFLSFVLFSSR